ncbi:MAG TPA: tRNA 2-thiocytidine(32) synthetase TtcA [Polyangiales bacterium]|nr:tRNA 2-thiocytidine(32) synthetase TtcA [Polyangiales bacterium]
MDELERLTRDLGRDLGRCVSDYALLQEGDRVMVCLSGGKDSYTLLSLLERLRRRSKVKFSLLAVHLDQGQPGYDGKPLADFLDAHGYEHRIIREDTYSVVKEHVPEGKTYCSLCSRLRRGVLYNVAQELGCSKIALGHHRDDAIETLFLNLMFTGSLRAMPPKLVSDDGRNVVIRPLMYVAEKDIARYAAAMAFPILPCNLCGSQEQLMRKQVKRMLAEIEASAPRARESMLAAMGNVRPSQLLDRKLWRALNLPVEATGADESSDFSEDARGLRLPLLT